LTTWLPNMAEAVRAGAFQHASVVIDFAAVDARTAAPLGAQLLSVAVTNQPFLSGMQRLAATRSGAPSQGDPPMTAPVPVLKLALTPGRNGRPGTLRLAAAPAPGAKPAWNQLPDAGAWATIVTRASADGVSSAAEAQKFLKALPESERDALGLSDAERATFLAGLLMVALAPKPEQPAQHAPEQHTHGLSKSAPLNATLCTGRNGVERAIVALRQHSPRFAAQSFEEQCGQASAALSQGLVIA
jgi:hypothetical protein